MNCTKMGLRKIFMAALFISGLALGMGVMVVMLIVESLVDRDDSTSVQVTEYVQLASESNSNKVLSIDGWEILGKEDGTKLDGPYKILVLKKTGSEDYGFVVMKMISGDPRHSWINSSIHEWSLSKDDLPLSFLVDNDGILTVLKNSFNEVSTVSKEYVKQRCSTTNDCFLRFDRDGILVMYYGEGGS